MEDFVAAARAFLTDVLFKYVPQLLLALLILFVGLKLIKLLNKGLEKSYKRRKLDLSLQQFLHSVIDISLKVLLVLTVMGVAGIKMTSFVAILGAAGLAVGMALQGTLQNFAGGVIILILRPFKVGDYIEQGTYEGFVESIQIFNTTLRTYDHRFVVVPNTELATKSLVNHFNLPQRRITVKVGIAYGESVEHAREVLMRAMAENPYIVQEPKAPEVHVDNLGDSAVNLILFAWTPAETYWPALFTLNEDVYTALGREGISIPFNQVDVHIKQD